jgi:hypothetical protein
MHPRNYANIQRRRYLERQPAAQSLAGLEVLLHLDSFCLGDTLCFASYLPDFKHYYQPSKLWVTTFWPELFGISDEFDVLDAVSPDTLVCDKLVSCGYRKEDLLHTTRGMFYAARASMGLPEALPGAAVRRPLTRPVAAVRQTNKIVLAPESTKSIARWDYQGGWGWQAVVDALVARGFEVHNISYETDLGLRNVIPHHGHDDIAVVRQHIAEARLFLGLSSGLAWLAWAYHTPVVMVAGFTKFFNEFPCYRVWNPHACNGCFNVFPDIKSPCPLFDNTDRKHECHRTITPDMVLAQVDRALADTATRAQH